MTESSQLQELEAVVPSDAIEAHRTKRQLLFLQVLVQHQGKFGSLPDASDSALFRELVADIEIHKQE